MTPERSALQCDLAPGCAYVGDVDPVAYRLRVSASRNVEEDVGKEFGRKFGDTRCECVDLRYDGTYAFVVVRLLLFQCFQDGAFVS